MKKYVPALLPVLLLLLSASTKLDYTGNNLLLLLGADPLAKDFKPVKEFWLLDKNLQNESGGLKLNVNSVSGKIQSILVAGYNFELNGVKYLTYSSPLPFNMQLTDDTATLTTKLGAGLKMLGRSTMKYYSGDFAIEVSYADLKSNRITSVKYYYENRPIAKTPVVEEKKTTTSKDKFQQKRNVLEDVAFASAPAAPVVTESVTTSTFKKSLLDVFAAYRDSKFTAIKNELRGSNNFWNYSYTYTTTVKIPGEKFNMLYSFPFVTSPLDFVSVLKESDAVDASFQNTYKDFEKNLMQNFPASEGWVSSCKPNKESKTLSDLEFTNDKYGSIILDYSKNPKGRNILYLRFLLFSD